MGNFYELVVLDLYAWHFTNDDILMQNTFSIRPKGDCMKRLATRHGQGLAYQMLDTTLDNLYCIQSLVCIHPYSYCFNSA